jgi:hypothetical protein
MAQISQIAIIASSDILSPPWLEPTPHARATELGARAVRVFGRRDGFDAGAHFIEVWFAWATSFARTRGLELVPVGDAQFVQIGLEMPRPRIALRRHRPSPW